MLEFIDMINQEPNSVSKDNWSRNSLLKVEQLNKNNGNFYDEIQNIEEFEIQYKIKQPKFIFIIKN